MVSFNIHNYVETKGGGGKEPMGGVKTRRAICNLKVSTHFLCRRLAVPICAFCDLSGQGNINFTNGRNGEPRIRPLPARRLDVAMTPAEQMASSGICLKAIRAGSVKTHNLRVADCR